MKIGTMENATATDKSGLNLEGSLIKILTYARASFLEAQQKSLKGSVINNILEKCININQSALYPFAFVTLNIKF